LQAIAYSFGACGVVDRLPNTTTAVPSWGECQFSVFTSFGASVIWLTVPVTEVTAPVTPLLLSGMLMCVIRIRLAYKVVRSKLVA
jgi:hypothetical protein